MTLPTLDQLPPMPEMDTARGGDPNLVKAELDWHIEQAILHHPRTLQVEIGPSELGIPCTRCLAHKLAGIPEHHDTAPWLPTVGTAVHSWLGDTFARANGDLHPARFLVETRVVVGVVDGRVIEGNADLYDRATATVVDWKVVGATALKRVQRHGPGEQYRVQGHLYGRGLARRGLPVDTIAWYFLPRNAVSFRQGKWICEPYDEQVGLAALAKADALAKALRTVGPEVILPTLPPTTGCYSCSRYPLPDGSYPLPAGHRPDDMADILGLD